MLAPRAQRYVSQRHGTDFHFGKMTSSAKVIPFFLKPKFDDDYDDDGDDDDDDGCR